MRSPWSPHRSTSSASLATTARTSASSVIDAICSPIVVARRSGSGFEAARATSRRSGSATAQRPQRNAATFEPTATPLSAIASSIRSGADRHAPGLHSHADDEDVGGGRRPEQVRGRCLGVEPVLDVRPRHASDPCRQFVGVLRDEIVMGDHGPGRRVRRRSDDGRPSGIGGQQAPCPDAATS